MQAATGRETKLAGQRVIGESIGLTADDQFFVKPVPAAFGQLEISHEMQHQAFGDRVFQSLIQFEREICRKHVTIVTDRNLRVSDLNFCGERQKRHESQQQQPPA
jgi:hypothetical protein